METPLQTQILDYPNYKTLMKYDIINSKEDFMHYCKVHMEEYKDENGDYIPLYLIVTKKGIHLSILDIKQSPDKLKDNPLYLSVDYNRISIYKLVVKADENNKLFLNYFDENYSKKYNKTITFISHRDSLCMHHLIRKFYIFNWQKIFETTILLTFTKLVYNRHFVVIKYNRFGSKQERTLLLTNALIFNIEHSFHKKNLDFKKKECKWSDSIKAIKKIVLFKTKECELILYMIKAINSAEVMSNLPTNVGPDLLKFKERREFEFYSVDEKNDFIAIIRMNYYKLTKKYVDIEMVDK